MPKANQPIDVPIANPADADAITSVAVVQTAEVTAGSPLGDLTSRPSGRPPREWAPGKPTVAYKLPKTFQVPASEDGVTWNFVIPTGVERELYLTGAELKPGNKALVQRMTLSFDATRTAREKDKQTPESGFASEASERPVPSIVLAEWLPGMMASPLPPDTGYLIPKGADLVLTVDYAASPVSSPDPWQMGLHITRTAPKHRLGRIVRAGSFPSFDELGGSPTERVIQSNTSAATYKLPTEATLYSIMPELEHGAQIRIIARSPSAQDLPVLHVEEWDARIPERYYLNEPITLPKDSRIVVQTLRKLSAQAKGSSEDHRAFRCEFEVSTPNPAHLEPLMRHNEAANLQP